MLIQAECENPKDLRFAKDWLADFFPDHRFVYFNVSGTALFYEAMKSTDRNSIVLPAYMCPDFSAAATRCGMHLAHIDADPATQLPNAANLQRYLEGQVPSETILVIDHSFGYPFPALDDIRSKFPGLLIVEDCARALGVRINGSFPGKYSDWVLLSMYKTTPGSHNGGILLTRAPVPLPSVAPVPATIRERMANMEAIRSMYHFFLRASRGVELPHDDLASPEWMPRYGLPSTVCGSRFAAQLAAFEKQYADRTSTAEELTEKLSRIEGIEVLRTAQGCRSAGHYVSVRTPSRLVRNRTILGLRKKGLFVMPTWHIIPPHYRALSHTFPFGSRASEDLAERMLQIPVTRLGRRRCQRLAREIPQFVSTNTSTAG